MSLRGDVADNGIHRRRNRRLLPILPGLLRRDTGIKRDRHRMLGIGNQRSRPRFLPGGNANSAATLPRQRHLRRAR